MEKKLLHQGDKLFVFSHFPYTYKEFPLSIMEGVDLVRRPDKSFACDNELKPYYYVLPMLNVNINPPHASIRVSGQHKNKDEIFWRLMLALRLIRPLEIGVSGAFLYTNENQCSMPGLYCISSVLNTAKPVVTTDAERYSVEDFQLAANIIKRIEGKQEKFMRLKMALDSFSHVTLGRSTSYSMIFLELFSCLESLFGSPSKGKELGEMISSFLSDVMPNASTMGEFITNKYVKNGRNDLSHGNPTFYIANGEFRPTINKERYSELLKIHEITRLCLLGFLGLADDYLKEYNQVSLNKLGKLILTYNASHELLKNQQLFLDHRAYQ